jgi:hypothetical protein
VKLHKGLEFRNEVPIHLSADKTVLNRDFGNVYADTDVTFEYQLKPIKELIKLEDVDISEMKHLPFQAQIEYTALDGSRQVRVITQRLEISNDREELEKKADYEIMGMNAIQKSNNIARQGDFKKAQVISKAMNNMMDRNTKMTSTAQQVQMNDFRLQISNTYQIMNQMS